MFKHLISRSRLVVHHHNITSKLLFSSSSTRLATYTDDPILNNTFTFTNKKKSWSTSVTPVNLIDDTVGELIEKSALERPNDVCYIFPHNKGLQIKFIELQERVNHIAQNLLALGFQKGERIAFLLPNTSELIVSMLAAASIGLVSVLLNPGYQLVEIEYMLNKVQCKGVVVYDTFKVLKHLDILKNICPEVEQSEPGELKSSKLPYLKHVIVLNSPLEKEKKIYKGTWSYNQISEKKLSNISYLKPYVDRDDLAFILFTSGTTGQPKGAAIKHFGIVNVCNYFNNLPFGKFGWGDRCVPIPLFHVFGLGVGLICPLMTKEKIVFPFYFPDTASVIKAISAYKCETLLGPPTILIDFLNHPERTKYDTSSLKKVLMGASTVPHDLILKLKNEINVEHVIIGYGMTETSMGESFTTCNDAAKSEKHAYQSIGRCFPNTEVKIIDPDTKETVDKNVDGELCIRGFNIIAGYYNDPEKTAQTIDKNGWLHTGDVCNMDEEGYIFFKSRCKDIIIRGGANIYPAEVEAFLRTHPKVIDVNVVGVPDERVGEEVCAWFKLKQDCKLTIDEVKEFCTGKIAHFKIPKYIKVVDGFPTNPNGKVLKNKIIEMAKKELKL